MISGQGRPGRGMSFQHFNKFACGELCGFMCELGCNPVAQGLVPMGAQHPQGARGRHDDQAVHLTVQRHAVESLGGVLGEILFRFLVKIGFAIGAARGPRPAMGAPGLVCPEIARKAVHGLVMRQNLQNRPGAVAFIAVNKPFAAVDHGHNRPMRYLHILPLTAIKPQPLQLANRSVVALGPSQRHRRPMHDIRAIRSDPAAFDAGLARRGLPPQSAALLAADAALRETQTQLQNGLARRNEASKAIGAAKAAKDEAKAAALMEEVSALKNRLPELEAQERTQMDKLRALLEVLPNVPAADVPEGADENDNVEIKSWGTPRVFDFTPREHDALGAPLGLDFETAASIAGARFVVMQGDIARLHRALGQFMLDLHGAKGYRETIVPLLVRGEALYGTSQLPKFAEDLFHTEDDRWLIPTAEVSLTNIVRERILEDTHLPLRFVALSQCFRAEAGAAGRDTRGMIRQHQFEKVELVSITAPEDSDAEHERMTACAEAVLQALELPYRRMLLCTGDMGFAARKTFDLEVWLPGQGRYREISSCSNCGDFQARRMDARFKRAGDKGTQMLHTLNGSGVAVGRALVAVLENYQQADGSIAVPAVLQPYMGGQQHIGLRA